MRILAVLLLLTACDLQPPKRDQGGGSSAPKPVTAARPPAAPPAPAPTPGSAAPAQPAPPPAPATPCQTVAAHITDLTIAGVTDPALKKQQEERRATSERRIAESCTREKWNDEKQKCFLDGKSIEDVAGCFKKFPLPGQEFPPTK